MTPIGERIRELRKQKGIGQDRLALKAGYDQSTLSKLERGLAKGVSIDALRRMANVLGVSLRELVRGTDCEELLKDAPGS